METVDAISFKALIALTDAALLLAVDSTGGPGPAQVNLGAVEPVPVTLPVLHCRNWALNQNRKTRKWRKGALRRDGDREKETLD